jgi:hypothetical protein
MAIGDAPDLFPQKSPAPAMKHEAEEDWAR